MLTINGWMEWELDWGIRASSSITRVLHWLVVEKKDLNELKGKALDLLLYIQPSPMVTRYDRKIKIPDTSSSFICRVAGLRVRNSVVWGEAGVAP